MKRKDKLSAALSSICPQKWCKTRSTTDPLTCGRWGFYFLSLSMAMPLLGHKIVPKSRRRTKIKIYNSSLRYHMNSRTLFKNFWGELRMIESSLSKCSIILGYVVSKSWRFPIGSPQKAQAMTAKAIARMKTVTLAAKKMTTKNLLMMTKATQKISSTLMTLAPPARWLDQSHHPHMKVTLSRLLAR